jgi:hypothetical protein
MCGGNSHSTKREILSRKVGCSWVTRKPPKSPKLNSSVCLFLSFSISEGEIKVFFLSVTKLQRKKDIISAAAIALLEFTRAHCKYIQLKFSFSKKATKSKFETIFHLIVRLLSKFQIKWKIISNLCGLFRMSQLQIAVEVQ